MYIVKNALRNLLRSKGRNILIGLIVLVIAVASCLALSIRQAAATARESGLENLAVTGQISLDRQAMMQKIQQEGGDMKNAFRSMESLSLEEMQTYAKSQYVKDFTYTLTTSLNILGAVIIGGAKSLWGTAFGTFAIYGLQSMFLSKIQFFTENPAFITMVTGLRIIVVVMFFPGGFAQMVLSLRGWIRKRGVERRLRSYVKDQL